MNAIQLLACRLSEGWLDHNEIELVVSTAHLDDTQPESAQQWLVTTDEDNLQAIITGFPMGDYVAMPVTIKSPRGRFYIEIEDGEIVMLHIDAKTDYQMTVEPARLN